MQSGSYECVNRSTSTAAGLEARRRGIDSQGVPAAVVAPSVRASSSTAPCSKPTWLICWHRLREERGRRPPLRPRRHRLAIRPQTRRRPPLPPTTSTVALGFVRGRAVRRPPLLARPRLLPAGREANRQQPRLPLCRAQTLPPRAPHPPRARRGRTRSSRLGRDATRRRGRLNLTVVCAPVIRPMPLRPAPAMLPPPAPTGLARLHRPSGRNPAGPTPDQSSRRRSDPRRSRPVKWCTTLSASPSPDAYGAAAIAITSSGSSAGSVSAFVIDSALM